MGKLSKFWVALLSSNSEYVLHRLKCKVSCEATYAGKVKTNFRCRFNNYKSKHRAFRKGNWKIFQKRFHNYYCLDGHLGIADWGFTLFKQRETHKQIKERGNLLAAPIYNLLLIRSLMKNMSTYISIPSTWVRQSVMKVFFNIYFLEIWISFSFINFLNINLFKSLC